MKTFTIVGFGEVGACFASLLNTQYSEITIHLVDPSETISGRILDFEHAARMKKNRITVNSENSFSETDYIIYTAGKCNPVDATRASLAQTNHELVDLIFKDKVISTNTIVIVITNPVEFIARAIFEKLGRKNLVIGTGTMLDSFRFSYILMRNYNENSVQTEVLGEHGEGMFPVFSNTYINGEKIKINSNEKELLIKDLKTSASQIRKTEHATKYGIAQCTLELICALEDEKPIRESVSVFTNDELKTFYQLEDHCFLNVTCKIQSRKVIQETPHHLTEEEKEALLKIGSTLYKQQQTISKLL
jgi:malate/lactate dehydrogenase